MALISNIPVEILNEIFALAVPDEVLNISHDGKHNSPSIRDVPVSISSVCNHWRNTVLAIPSIWSRLFIEIDSETRVIRPPIDTISLWLQRSGTQSLSLSIQDYGPAGGSEENGQPIDRVDSQLEALLDVLKVHLSRWTWFELCTPNASVLPTSLVQLSVPSLLSVHIMMVECDVATFLPLIANSSHISLQYETSGIDDIRFVLANCPHLTQLEFTLDIADAEEQEITHTVLQHVSIYAKDDPADFFDHLKLPSLEYLGITGENLEEPRFVLDSFISRSRCNILELSLESAGLNEANLISLLQVCPKLEKLTLSEETEGDNHLFSNCVVERLTLNQRNYLCSHLTYLGVSFCVGSSDGKLGTMVESRKDTGLTSVYICMDGSWYEENKKDIEKLTSLESKGMKVELDRF